MNKLALGTAQFGLDYGVTNSKGKVQVEEVELILGCAKENSINTLDTAPSYGNSEEVLGSIGISDFQIITKTIPLKNGVDEVIKHFKQSLTFLNKSSVNGLLIHNINEIEHKNFNTLFKELTELKEIKETLMANKTISGAIGSLIFSMLLIPFNYEGLLNKNLPSIFIITIVISVISQLGDLFISFIKRKAKIKDTGNLLPGHGGVLDRVDGIIFAVPFSYFLLRLI